MKTMRTIILAVILFTGCAVGPKFRSPEVIVPPNYIAGSADNYNISQVESLRKWWQKFNDPILDSLIQRAVEGNRNLASAVKNIEIARMQTATVKSQALPSISLVGSGEAKYTHATKIVQDYSIMPTVSWDIGLWGKVRRQAEAAGAAFVATEYEVAAIVQNLTAEVATTYFSALSYEYALQIAQRTYISRDSSQRLMEAMFYYGSISDVDLQQSKASLATAGTSVEQYKRALEQTILALNLLMGENPHNITLGTLKPVNLTIPAGLESSLLERRPDVIQAYYAVQQANAMIGVAVANRLPSISLTGAGGLATTVVRDVATGYPLAWNGAASLIAPILNWGTLRREEKTARIKTEQAVLAYEQAVLGAISEFEQSLVAVDTYNREIAQCVQMVVSSEKAAILTNALYRSGSASYLDVLDADRTLFAAQLQYVQTINNQIASYITLYKALGGGY